MTRKTSLFIALLMAVVLPMQAQTDEEVVQSIKDDIQAVKAKTRETRNLLRDQERDLRKLTAELEKTRNTIQQNKQKERDARKSGKTFTPKPVERTYRSIYGVNGVPEKVKDEGGKVKDEKKVAEKAKDEKGKDEGLKGKDEKKMKEEKKVDESADKKDKQAKDDKKVKDEKKGKVEDTTPSGKEEKAQPKGKEKAAPPVPNRRISDKEALRLQKQRNKYYEEQLKEKKKAEKDAEKTRKKMEKEQKKEEPPVASARRQRDTKETEKAESEEE